MKTIIKTLLLAATLSIASFTATATPQYSGNTFGTAIGSDSGYYLWNDAMSPSNWYLRWTDNSGARKKPSWFGRIEFIESALGTVSEFQFGGSDQTLIAYDQMGTGSDQISWQTRTNTSGGVDGINFSLTSSIELMRFTLGSSRFTGLPTMATDPGLESTDIFIGSGYASTNALVTTSNRKTRQSFEILVPAPGALALLGLGLLGLGLVRRKQTNKSVK
jgi:hypothetical protein